MKTLKISEQDAKRYYPTASDEFRTVLETTFGKEFFSEKITDKIKSWNDVILELGVGNVILPYSENMVLTKQQKSINALYKIQCITKVLNEGWESDFSNSNEDKYYPWFEYKKSGWSLASVFYGYVDAHFPFGCYYKTKQLAEHSVKFFIDIYKEYLP